MERQCSKCDQPIPDGEGLKGRAICRECHNADRREYRRRMRNREGYKRRPAPRTETHRKCNRCLQWRTHDQFEPQRARCRECRREQSRSRYRKLTTDQLDEHIRRSNKNYRKRRAWQNSRRFDDCQLYIERMELHGLIIRDICRAAGLDAKCVHKLKAGEGKYVQQETVDKLRDAWERIEGTPHAQVVGRREESRGRKEAPKEAGKAGPRNRGGRKRTDPSRRNPARPARSTRHAPAPEQGV